MGGSGAATALATRVIHKGKAALPFYLRTLIWMALG